MAVRAAAAMGVALRDRIHDLVREPFARHRLAASLGEMRLHRVRIEFDASRDGFFISLDWVAGGSPPNRGVTDGFVPSHLLRGGDLDVEGIVRRVWAEERVRTADLGRLYRDCVAAMGSRAFWERFDARAAFANLVTSKEAEEKGRRLLIDNLTPEQRSSFDLKGEFMVTGGETGTTYRVRHCRTNNVDVLGRRGRRVRTLCFLPVGGLCLGDQLLAQKVALESYEMDALRVAVSNAYL